MITTDEEAWEACSPEDLWLFDKLIVSRMLGYQCGPAGVPVPQKASYIVRPVTNLSGMGRGAWVEHLEGSTGHLPPGSFWCELFEGRHLSIDYQRGTQCLAVEGFRNSGDPLYRFSHWVKTSDHIPLPTNLSSLKKFENLNIEFIGGKVIEIHLRQNPDFKYGNSVAIPVWEDMKFVSAPDYLRRGFLIA